MTTKLLIDRELLERIDESAICDGTDATISDDLFTQLVAALAAQRQPVEWRCRVAGSDHYAHFPTKRCRFCEPLYTTPQPAPAQDVAGWIPVTERLPEVPEGDEQEVIVCVQRAHNRQRYVFSARYLNNFPLHNDYDEPTIASGWHDVKEHADYDGWYSPLGLAEGDEIVGWMPLPPAPKVV